MIKNLYENRKLLFMMAKRDVQLKYKGSILGVSWNIITPIIMLIIYTFVFSSIFKMRWSEVESSKYEFALILYIGILFYGVFADAINSMPRLISSNVNFVKKIVYPLETLAIVQVLVSLFNFTMGFIIWILAYILLFGWPPSTIFLIPLVILPFSIVLIGLGWFLSATGVFLRDTPHVTTIVTSTLMFLTPVFYPLAAVPEKYRILIYLNPLATVIESARSLMFWGEIPNILVIAVLWVSSFIIAILGLIWFQNIKGRFADVL